PSTRAAFDGPVLVTGATGYVGGRLRRLLESKGWRVRCLARRRAWLESRVGPTTEVFEGDVLDAESLQPALAGAESAYYLIHSMGAGADFEARDRTAARNFAGAARRAGVRRIVYLGGLGQGQGLSPHLRSRHEVGDLLRESGLPVLELRASIVIGSGSLSFEMIRALVERLPVMITPRWVEVEAQPIAIDDLLAYLVAALEIPLPESRVFEIGGEDRVSYGDLMREYAGQRGLRRTMVRVPVLTPRLSSLWLGLVTPLYARVGRALIESIKHPTVVRNPSAREAFAVRPRGSRDAIAAAIRNEDREIAESRWYDAFSSGAEDRAWTGVRFGHRLVDSRERDVAVGPADAFAPIRRIGGTTGWYAYDALWRLRGFFDLLAGGVGVRRGRPSPEEPHVGDALDFWRVEAYEPDRRLRLAAEMKLPGRAWLEFEVVPREGGATIRQTALFDPVGLGGLAYWYALLPLHRLVFSGMLRGIAGAATERSRAAGEGRRRGSTADRRPLGDV
ncbi:MAG: SDR family oxidoreductase, partial [Hyphomicrobiales bacterium]